MRLTLFYLRFSIAGTLIHSITYKDEHEGITEELKYLNSLSAPTLIDLDFDGVVDIAYAGDRNGNLYRFDFRGDTKEDWKVDLIFKGDVLHPIVQAPSLSRFDKTNVIVFGTGSQEIESDFPKGEDDPVPQYIYGIYENNQFTAHRDNPLVPDSNSFIDQKFKGSLSDQYRTITNNDIIGTAKGWRLVLDEASGEAISGKISVLNGSLFVYTYIYKGVNAGAPTDAICYRSDIGASTWLLQINALTGGQISSKGTRLKDLSSNDALKINDQVAPAMKLIGDVQPISQTIDGEMQSSNNWDQELDPSKSKVVSSVLFKGQYIDEKGCLDGVEYVTSEKMDVICEKYSKNTTSRRISIRKRL